MELKILLSNTYHLGKTRFVKFILSLVRAKFNAIFLGPTGIGIISQILNTTSRFSTFTLLEVQHGLVKQIASRKDSTNFENQLLNSLKSYIILIFIVSIIVLLLTLFFAEKLTIVFFGDIKYYKYYLICVVSFPILVINSIPFSLLKSFKNIKLIAKARLLSVVLSFIIFIPLVFYFQLVGAVITLVLTSIFTLVFNHIYAKKNILNNYSISLSKILSKGRIIQKDLIELFNFAGWGLTIGVYHIFTVIMMRSILINQLGIDKLGLYSPNKAWGALFTGIVTQQLFTYLFPRFSEVKKNSEITGILNDVFRLTTFFMIPFLFGGIAFREIIIPFFYSSEFSEAANYLPGHFIGILFTMWMYSFTQVFAPTGRLKTIVFFNFFIYSINLGLIYFLVPIVGLYAWMLRFIVTPVLFFFIFSIYLNKNIGFSISKDNMFLMLYAVSSSLLLYGIVESNNLLGYVLSFFFLFISWFFLRKNEKKQIITKLKLFIRI